MVTLKPKLSIVLQSALDTGPTQKLSPSEKIEYEKQCCQSAIFPSNMAFLDSIPGINNIDITLS